MSFQDGRVGVSSRLRIAEAAGESHVGRREGNEDAWLADPLAGLVVVADGVGGRPRGEVASRLAAGEIARRIAPDLSPRRRLARAVAGAGEAVWQRAGRKPGGMLTTAACFLADPSESGVAVAHVGDSRVYALLSGGLRLLTRDHAMGGALIRALGDGPEVEADARLVGARAGDVFMACTDGLSGVVPDPFLRRALQIATFPGGAREAARRLVVEALRLGGTDNVTVAIARLEAAR